MRKIGFMTRTMLAMLMCAAMFIVTSCSDDENLSDLSGITSFSVEGFTNKFTIDQIELKIFNQDSLPYGTETSFVVNYQGIDGVSVSVDGNEITTGATIDFSSPVTFKAVSEDGKTIKNYTVDVRISQVNPDAVSWVQKVSGVFDESYTSQEAYFFKGKAWMLAGKLLEETGGAKLYSSTDGVSWTEETIDPSSFPVGMYQDVVEYNGKLYVAGVSTMGSPWGFPMAEINNDVYTSTDGINWTVAATNPFGWNNKIHSYAFGMTDKLVLVAGNNASFGNLNGSKPTGANFYPPAGINENVAVSTDGATWDLSDTIVGEDMPLRRDQANFVHNGKMYIAGGLSTKAEVLGDVWSSTDGANWTQVAASGFTPRMKMPVIEYDGKLYMIGGQLADGTCTKDILVSEDAGATWNPAPAIIQLPASFTPRAGHSAFVDDNNQLWIVGGFSTTVSPVEDGIEIEETLIADVWVGKLNKFNE